MSFYTLFQNKQQVVSDSKPESKEAEPRQNDWNLFEEGHLLVDMYDTSDAIVVRALVAGIEPDQLEISLHNDMLTIRGARKDQEDLFDDQYLIRECYWGTFSRSMIIPVPVQTDAIAATFKNGIVTIILPKTQVDHSIPIAEENQFQDDESPYWEDENS